METRHIHIADYNYPLPDERIAKYPLDVRDQSKLLVYRHGEISETAFYRLPEYLPEGTLMVFNNTKVIQARIHFRKDNAQGEPVGALIEVFLLEPAAPRDYEQMFQARGQCSWICMVGNQKKWKDDQMLRRAVDVKGRQLWLCAVRQHAPQGERVTFTWQDDTVSFAEILDAVGELPIPPYLNRETQERDKTTYQTVYSKIKGSVAAPTAGLHFTDEVLQVLDSRGIDREELTLHVGAGTFKPVKSEEIAAHEMHTEHVCVSRQTLQKLLRHDCRAIAVGTTSVRTLESLYYMGLKLLKNPMLSEEELHVAQWEPYESVAHLPSPREAIESLLNYLDRNQLTALHSSTQIMIAPGYDYKIVQMLITNFHQPQSTLLLLVSAFVGGNWRAIYDYALNHQFRFLSYGDSSLLIP